MSEVKDIFSRNIEQKIEPVIYFHTIEPDVASREVNEYVFTSRSRDASRNAGGIHEEMVDLLTNIYAYFSQGATLPASWVSGFFGSGKSSFAKLLGLALDGMKIPKLDSSGNEIGTWSMKEALISRDDTANAGDLEAAFARLLSVMDPMTVLFDIGTMAQNNEIIPYTAYREILKKLGYSSMDGVAHYELALEENGSYEEFLKRYKSLHNAEWSAKKDSGMAALQFRSVYKGMFPEQGDLLDITTFKNSSLSVHSMVDSILAAMDRRAPGKTLFIVVDEVSQYITGQDDSSKVNLQSFISEIGSRTKPGLARIWFIATGQEKLEEENKTSALFKLQDRFPPHLRVHLDRSNVHEVVERRLLKKKTGSEKEQVFSSENMNLLKLYGWECSSVTREQVIADYPLLPEHIPLFMDITQSLRDTSSKSQSDSGGVRSVLNNIWSMLNEAPVSLKDRSLGTLITLDMLYDIIGSSVDTDIKLTVTRLIDKHGNDCLESKTAKAIALLEMNSESRPVTTDILARLLYPHLGSMSILNDVEKACELLKKENWIQYNEKTGWSIQNNAAQEWNRQKAEISVSAREVDELLQGQLQNILESVSQPIFPKLGVRFPLCCYWNGCENEQKFYSKNDQTSVSVCFYLTSYNSSRDGTEQWLEKSRSYKTMIHWVSGDTSSIENLARELKRSQKMIARYNGQQSLSPINQRLLVTERTNTDSIIQDLKKEMRSVWLDGSVFFDGGHGKADQEGSTFDAALKGIVESRIERIYHSFEAGNNNLSDSDFKQLLNRDISGLSRVFLDGPHGLGLACVDSGKITIRPEGFVPGSILNFIRDKNYVTGEKIFNEFMGPPWGWSKLVIKSSVIALLRSGKIRFDTITSIIDPGAKNIFESDREFSKSSIEVRNETEGDSVSGRDRNEMQDFFDKTMHLPCPSNDSDTIADLLFREFPKIKDSIIDIERSLSKLSIKLPKQLTDLNEALTECITNRTVDVALNRFKSKFTLIKQGYPALLELRDVLDGSAQRELLELRNILSIQSVQLEELDEHTLIAQDKAILVEQFALEQPWRSYADAKPAGEAIKEAYRLKRIAIRKQQDILRDQILDRIKSRREFSDLDEDDEREIISIITSAYKDIDEHAVEPRLVSLARYETDLKNAEDYAQRKIDTILNAKNSADKVQTVKSGLRNRIISGEEELEGALTELKERCKDIFASGGKVRFEE